MMMRVSVDIINRKNRCLQRVSSITNTRTRNSSQNVRIWLKNNSFNHTWHRSISNKHNMNSKRRWYNIRATAKVSVMPRQNLSEQAGSSKSRKNFRKTLRAKRLALKGRIASTMITQDSWHNSNRNHFRMRTTVCDQTSKWNINSTHLRRRFSRLSIAYKETQEIRDHRKFREFLILWTKEPWPNLMNSKPET